MAQNIHKDVSVFLVFMVGCCPYLNVACHHVQFSFAPVFLGFIYSCFFVLLLNRTLGLRSCFHYMVFCAHPHIRLKSCEINEMLYVSSGFFRRQETWERWRKKLCLSCCPYIHIFSQAQHHRFLWWDLSALWFNIYYITKVNLLFLHTFCSC